MSLSTTLRRHWKAAISVFTLAAVVLVPAALMAWGPGRATFTTAHPADYVTFNSITDNPAYGDERNFLRVKPASASDSAYSDKTKLEAGKEYEAYIYYHNNAAANLNLVAKDTTLRVELPAVVDGDTQSVAYITSSNAKPQKIWDETTLTSDSAMALRMVPGSAKIHNFGATNGKTLANDIITSGVKLGYNALDGNVPGCNEYAGYVTFRFVADQPNFTVDKLVSKHGDNKWVETYTAQPGETVDYLLKYKNTGTVTQKDVVIKDSLPAGMTYVSGSTVLGNPANPAGVKASDNVTTSTGINVGTYNPGQNAWVIFSAKAPAESKLVCGVNTLVNKETVETDNGSKSDTATVTVTKECEEPKDIEVCRLSDKKIVTISEDEFNTTEYSKNLNDCKEEEPKDIDVCRLSDFKIVTIKEDEFDASKYSKNLADCDQPEEITVCRLSDKTYVTILETEYNTEEYSKNPEDCKTPEQPKEMEVCRLSDKEIVTITDDKYDETKYSTTLSDCDETPKTPELPHTGPAETVMGTVGVGMLTLAGGYYLASRRALGQN